MQQIIVFVIIAAAAVYIGRMLWNALFGKGGCHSCSSNHTSSGPKAKTAKLPQHLIQLQTSPKHDEQHNGSAKSH